MWQCSECAERGLLWTFSLPWPAICQCRGHSKLRSMQTGLATMLECHWPWQINVQTCTAMVAGAWHRCTGHANLRLPLGTAKL